VEIKGANQLKALIFDTETTGINDPEIIEAAWLQVRSPLDLEVLDSFEQRYRPGKLIELGALATHHIMDEDLAGMPESATFALPGEVTHLIGHNIDYDWKVAGSPEVRKICTLALSRYLFPTINSHSQSAMLYHLERATARQNLVAAHSALADVHNCRRVLGCLVRLLPAIQTWDDLWRVSEAARVPTVMSFGKHKGELIRDVPRDYKRWLLGQNDIDPYLRQALTA
jgi:exodeoxyribonuclease X